MTSLQVPRRVIVDDIDPQIQYAGDQWILLDDHDAHNPPRAYYPPEYGLPFQNTSHFTNTTTEALSLSLRFQGSSPQVFGASLGAAYECFIDGTSIESTFGRKPLTVDGTTKNSGLLCDGAQFAESREYTLTLIVSTTPGDLSRMLVFDYITYIPSAFAPPTSATVLVDRLDPAIVYHGLMGGIGWTVGILDNPAIYTQTNNSSLTFNFNGTSVTWVGFVPRAALNEPTSNATYSIDGAEPVLLRLYASSENLTNQVFFTLPNLNPGPHSLEVIYQGSSVTPPLTLNHFVVANNVSTLSAISPVVSSSLRPRTMTSTTAISDDTPNPSTPVGAIIGSVVAGVAILCLVTILVWRRHRRRGREELAIDDDDIAPLW